MSDSPTISVLMAVYNGVEYLPLAIESILNQTYRDFEFIIIDDGSKDESPSLIRDYASRDSRIKFVSRPNKGLTVTLNEGLELCRGEFVARMDGDDISFPRRFESQLEHMRQHSDVVLCGGAFELIDDKGRLLTRITPPKDDAQAQQLALSGHTPIPHPAVFMRRGAVVRVGGYDTHFKTTQDLDLYLRLGEVGKFGFVDDVVLQFRQHEQSISESKRVLQRQFAREACERAWTRRGLSNMQFDASEPWRPGKDRSSRHKFALQYGWWAWQAGQRRTAMVYGTRAVLAKPWEPAGYKLLSCALVKSLPATNS